MIKFSIALSVEQDENFVGILFHKLVNLINVVFKGHHLASLGKLVNFFCDFRSMLREFRRRDTMCA
eukprot:c46564_g1_i1 orf=3-200(+)